MKYRVLTISKVIFDISIIMTALLVSRSGAATVTLTPAQTIAQIQLAINASNPGDTVNFAAGNYSAAPNGSNGALQFAAGRHYVGNGAIIALSSGVDATGNQNLINAAGGATSATATEITGFTFTDAQVLLQNGWFNVHNNSCKNVYRGFYVVGNSGAINNNSFSHTQAEGVYGYPAGNGTYDNNAFDYSWEPIHLVAAVNAVDVSNNVLTHVTRFGIELQEAMTNLTVENNYVGLWLANGGAPHCALSCATGYGKNITIKGNQFYQTSGDGGNYTGVGCAIESMGSNVAIGNNKAWGWNCFILDGAQAPAESSNNAIYGGVFSNDDSVPYTPSPFASTNDTLEASLAAFTPPPPPAAANVPQPNPPAAATPSPIVISAGPAAGQVTVAFPVTTAPSALAIYGTSEPGTTLVQLGNIPAGATEAVIGNIPNLWVVAVTLGGVTSNSYQVTTGSVPSYAPALVSTNAPVAATQPTPAPPAPTVTHTIQSLSNGKITIDGGAAQ